MDDKLNARKSNWKPEEVKALAEGALEKLDIIRAKFDSHVSMTEKNSAWQFVLDKVNAIASEKRTPKEIKKKWSDVTSKLRKKESERRKEMNKTGGGTFVQPSYNEWETLIVQTFASCKVEGIEGGSEIFEPGDDPKPIAEVTASGDNIVSVIEEEVEATEIVVEVDEPVIKKRNKVREENTGTSFHVDYLQLEKERNDIEKEKLAILKEISSSLKEICGYYSANQEPSLESLLLLSNKSNQ